MEYKNYGVFIAVMHRLSCLMTFIGCCRMCMSVLLAPSLSFATTLPFVDEHITFGKEKPVCMFKRIGKLCLDNGRNCDETIVTMH